VYVENDPERRHAGPDEAEIGGEVYLRGEGEDRGCFEARLRAAAVSAGGLRHLGGFRTRPLRLKARIEAGTPVWTIANGATNINTGSRCSRLSMGSVRIDKTWMRTD
jgi:hypothetical protein